MQVATVSASTILRNTSLQSDASATGAAPNAGVLRLQQASLALDWIRQSMSSDADDAKSRAQRKLEEAKQELQALRTAGFPPEVIARMAAELARKVGAAASEFAAAVATGGSAGAAAPVANAASAATTATADAASAATADTTAAATDTTDTGSQTTGAASSDAKKADNDSQSDDQTTESDAAAQARKAYQSVVEDGPKSSGISAEDRQTMEEFKSVINELKQILEKAMRELRQKNRQGDHDDQATAVPAGRAAAAATIPSSIVI